MTLDEAWLTLRANNRRALAQLSEGEFAAHKRALRVWRTYVKPAAMVQGSEADAGLHVLDTLAHEGRLGEACEATLRRLERRS